MPTCALDRFLRPEKITLVNTIRYMLRKKGINYDWCNITRIMATQTIQTVELRTDNKNIHLRKPSRPIKQLQDIYRAIGCKIHKRQLKNM